MRTLHGQHGTTALSTSTLTVTNVGWQYVYTNKTPAIDITVGFTTIDVADSTPLQDHYVYLPDGTHIGQIIYLDFSTSGSDTIYVKLLTDSWMNANSSNPNTSLNFSVVGIGKPIQFIWFGSDWKTYT